MLKQGDSCRGWGRDSDRIGLVIYWWGVGWVIPLVVMFVRGSGFYWQGIKIRWLSISDFNRRSGSRFAIVAGLNCVI